MALIKDMKGSFVGGKISRALQNRIDLQKFNTWLKEAKNTHIQPEGGISNRAGTVFVCKATTYTLTINVNVSATIIINGIIYTGYTASVNLPINSNYTYSVSASGYSTSSGSGTLLENTEKEITLEENENTYTFSIINGQGATISIKAGNETPVTGTGEVSVTAEAGTLIEWKVELEGYVSQTNVLVLSEDKTETVILEQEGEKLTLTVVTYPPDANVTINGETTKSVRLDYGDSYTIVVSKTGYQTSEVTGIITEDKTVSVSLVATSIVINNITTTVYGTDYLVEIFNQTIQATANYQITLAGGKGEIVRNAGFYLDTRWGAGGKVVIQKQLNAGDNIVVKKISGSYQTAVARNYEEVIIRGGCGIGLWINNELVAVAGGGGVLYGYYTQSNTTNPEYACGGGYNGGGQNGVNEYKHGFSYNGNRGNNTAVNTSANGGMARTTMSYYINNGDIGRPGSGYIHNDYSQYANLAYGSERYRGDDGVYTGNDSAAYFSLELQQ